MGDSENRDFLYEYGSLSLDESEIETAEQKRKRLDSELTDQIENFDYSTLREIMDGETIPTPTPTPPLLITTIPNNLRDNKKEYPPEYESFTSILKRTDHPPLISVESTDEWLDLGKRDFR